MITTVKVNGAPNSSDYIELMYEDDSEVSSLPTNVAVGSVAVKVDGSKVYRLKSDGTWVEVVL